MIDRLARWVIGHPTIERLLTIAVGYPTQISEFYHGLFAAVVGLWLVRPGHMFLGLPGLQALAAGHPPEEILGALFLTVAAWIFGALWLHRPRPRLWAMGAYTCVMFTVLSSLWSVWATVLFPVLLYFVVNPLHVLLRIWLETKFRPAGA